MKTIVFLGAGASAAEGAPTQASLFREYFRSYQRKPPGRIHHAWDRELATFFLDFFGLDVDYGDVDTMAFPTFEEVLGILELARSQDESFRDWGTSHIVDGGRKPRVEHVHDLLVLLIAEILDETLPGPVREHFTLVRSLGSDVKHWSFVSFNYDILIDNALLQLYPEWDLEYGVAFTNYAAGTWTRPRAGRIVRLLKLHGSLNWLYCPTCRTVELTPKEKGICRLKWDPAQCLCPQCETLAVPIVIPPTYFKVLSNLFLRQVWDAAERALVECDRIVFCGYSFPDADVHVRYLLKRMEVNAGRHPEIFIINEHGQKTDDERNNEWTRYLRFFVDKSRVHWTSLSFADFARLPGAAFQSKNWKSRPAPT